ncbi:MAG: hypothetical protein L0I76_29555 [Pseudonocardia sp.]|nr:hypothetical protein [Pseudonocardia sp.]
MTAPTRLICAPWVIPDELPEARPALTDEAWLELCWQASETLYSFSGRQFAGVCESTVVLDGPRRPGGRGWPVWRPDGGWPVGAAPVRPVREGYVVVSLPDPPVTGIVSVTVDGTVFASWTVWLPAGQLERSDGRAWPLDGSTRVTYSHGIPPPTGGVRSATVLALELGKAAAGDGNCKLPKRITNMQREGVTVSLMDAGESADKQRTGLLDVDTWLATVNPHRLARRASVWSPDRPRTRKVT